MRGANFLLVLLALGACTKTVEIGPIMSGESEAVVRDAADAAERRLGSDGPEDFTVEVQLVDKYGNESTQPALAFAWSDADRQRMNREKIDGLQLVNLATVTILSPRGVIALQAWCAREEYRSVTGRLCGVERARAEDQWVLRLNEEAKNAGSTGPQGL